MLQRRGVALAVECSYSLEWECVRNAASVSAVMFGWLEKKHGSPDWATVDMSMPCSSAMKPNTEKMAKPATKLVLLFRRQRRKESLKGQTGKGHSFNTTKTEVQEEENLI